MSERLKLNLFSLAILAFGLTISSCSKEPETEGFINIDDQYEIKIHQLLSEEGGVPIIQVSTLEPQECKNAYISYSTNVTDQKFELILNDIRTEGECEVGNELIHENIPIQATEMSFPFEINVKDIVTNDGTFINNLNKFELQLDNFDGLKISKTKILKIQKHNIWGSFSSSSENVLAEIRTVLQDANQNSIHLHGDYGYFYVAPDDSVTVYEQEEGEGFLITSDIDLDELHSTILFLKENDPSLEFQATYFDGSVLKVQ